MQEITTCLSSVANSSGNQPTHPSSKLQKAQSFSHAVYGYELTHQLQTTCYQNILYLVINAGTVAIYQAQTARHACAAPSPPLA